MVSPDIFHSTEQQRDRGERYDSGSSFTTNSCVGRRKNNAKESRMEGSIKSNKTQMNAAKKTDNC
jgi:hypothetical protein